MPRHAFETQLLEKLVRVVSSGFDEVCQPVRRNIFSKLDPEKGDSVWLSSWNGARNCTATWRMIKFMRAQSKSFCFRIYR